MYHLQMKMPELTKSKTHLLTGIIEYVPHSIVSKTIINKMTGNISVVAIDSGEVLDEYISPFDIHIQIIEGQAEIQIDGKQNILQTGEIIIIPAHSSNSIKANEQVKMISTVIKSGYEGNLL